MKGKKRTPTAVLEARGSFNKNPQRRRTGEPTPPPGRPLMPKNLGRHGARCWKQTVEFLETMKTLSKADKVELEIFARAYQEYREATDDVHANGIVVRGTTPNGCDFERRNPAVLIRKAAAELMLKMAGDFGLNPAGRARLVMNGEQKPDPLDALFAARKHQN